MKKTISKPITLIGPSGVGKILVAKELSKKLNLDVICIDDLIQFISLEQNGKISKSKSKQKEYALSVISDLKSMPEYAKFLEKDDTLNKTIELITNVLNEYTKYNNLIGPLKQYYNLLSDNDQLLDKCNKPIELIMALNDLSEKIVSKITHKLKKSYILDVPASFGWEINPSLAEYQCMFSHQTIDSLNQQINNHLCGTTTILLEPGQDYITRNPSASIDANKMILNDISAYYNSADIVISTNSLFFEPNNRFLKQRSWFNAEEYITKDKLKNTAEINNICNQIIESINELNSLHI